MDGERYVGRNQQQLATPAQTRLTVDVREHLSFQQEQEGKAGQGGLRNLCRFYGELGFDMLDEESMVCPVSPSFPVRNDSFHGIV